MGVSRGFSWSVGNSDGNFAPRSLEVCEIRQCARNLAASGMVGKERWIICTKSVAVSSSARYIFMHDQNIYIFHLKSCVLPGESLRTHY